MPWLQKKSKKSKSPSTHAKPYYYIRVPTGHGYKPLNTGTSDKKTAQQMEAMIHSLYRGKRRDPELLAWLLDRQLPVEQRLKPLVLLAAFEANALDELRAKRAAALQGAEAPVIVNVNDYVDAWHKDVKRRSSSDNANRFLRALRSFMPEDPEESEDSEAPEHSVVTPDRFSHSALLDWANSLQEPMENEGLGLSAETARRYRVGLLNFIDHLVSLDVLSRNPLAKIQPPKKGKSRDRHLSTAHALQLVSAFAALQNEPLATFIALQGIDVCDLQGYNALLMGAGVEVSVALNLLVGDLRLADKEARAPGTKNYNRDRVVRIAEWAMPFVAACAVDRPADERLFATIRDRWIANDAFNHAIAPLVESQPRIFGDYWMRDGRHTYAVRAIKAGTPPHVVAMQLGHKDATLVNKVYGVYAPSSVERNHWEMAAAKRDGDLNVGLHPSLPRVRAVTSRSPEPDVPKGGHTPKIAWPAKKELLRRLKSSPMVAVAEELGVSDKALRKHLLRQGVTSLPDGRRRDVARRGSLEDAPASSDRP